MDNNSSFLGKLREEFKKEKVDIKTYSPLSLAYIGDAVYDLVIRSILVSAGNIPNGQLHKKATGYVSAVSQAAIVDKIMGMLTEEEAAVYRRGKNSKPSSSAKNASQKEYLKATGFEALIGYLYLKDDEDRIIEIVRAGIDGI